MTRRILWFLFVTGVGVGTSLAGTEDVILQGRRDGTLLFTNIPSRRHLRPRETKQDSKQGIPRNRAPVEEDPIAAIIREAAERSGLREDLLRAVIAVESGFRPAAISPRGAMGLMQLMPGTAEALGVAEPFDPRENVLAGARHLRGLLDRFHGDLRMALAAYNAGETRVRERMSVPPYPETRNYVRRILERIGTTSGGISHPRQAQHTEPIYYFVDSNGVLHFTDVPREGVRAIR